MKNQIEIKYQYAEFLNVVLHKFFATQDEVDIFKQQHLDYIYIN
jgi:hypothetical protein